jgi:hypothetical protein
MATRTKSTRATAFTQNEANLYACVFFPEEKKYSVLSCTKIRQDRENKARKFVLQGGQEYDLVIICKGNKQACEKRARIFEKALETDANNDLSSACSDVDESETYNYSISSEESVKRVTMNNKNQTKKKRKLLTAPVSIALPPNICEKRLFLLYQIMLMQLMISYFHQPNRINIFLACNISNRLKNSRKRFQNVFIYVFYF